MKKTRSQANETRNQAGVTILVSGKNRLMQKKIKRDRKRYFILIKETINENTLPS